MPDFDEHSDTLASVAKETQERTTSNEPNKAKAMKAAKKIGMAYEKPTTSYVRMNNAAISDRMEVEADNYSDKLQNKGVRNSDALENLRETLRAKYGSVTRGWRECLDERGMHQVSQYDFFRALQKLGIGGFSKTAWEKLVGNRKGHDFVTFADIDPEHAKLLGNFYREFTARMGPLHTLVESSDALVVSKKGFLSRCGSLRQFEINVDRVFDQLQTNGKLTSDDCAWLEYYVERKCAYCGNAGHSLARCPNVERPTIGATVPTRLPADWREVSGIRAQKHAVNEFRMLLQHRFGGTVMAWRKRLDPDGTGVVTNQQLQKTANYIGFQGDVAAVWKELSGGGDFTAKLTDLAPAALDTMTAFESAVKTRFGSFRKCFQEMVGNEKPLVTRQEFCNLCVEINMQKNHHFLFDLLDEQRCGSILLQAIDQDAATKQFGEARCKEAEKTLCSLKPYAESTARKTLMQRSLDLGYAARAKVAEVSDEEKPSARLELLAFLEERFKSPIRAWAVALDINAKGKLKRSEFEVSCAVAGYVHSVSRIWDELELKPKSCLRLKDFAPEALAELNNFRANTLGNFSNDDGFIMEDKTHNYKITKEEFLEMALGAGHNDPAALQRIWPHIDIADVGFVMSRQLRWLHDVKSDSKSVPTMLAKMKELKRKQQQENARKEAIDFAQFTKQQDQKLQTTRDKAVLRKEGRAAYKSLIQFLSKKYGGLTRAWRVALDPDKKEELDFRSFLDGLVASGFLNKGGEPEVPKEQMEVAQYLFRRLTGDERSKGLTLANLDQHVGYFVLEFKRRCVERWGSLALAFLDFTPVGNETIPAAVLKTACHQVKLGNGAHRLLEYFDPGRTGEVRLTEISESAFSEMTEMLKEKEEAAARKAELDKKQNREHMVGLADSSSITVAVGVEARALERKADREFKMLKLFKETMCHHYGDLVTAWKELFKNEKSVGYSSFKTAYRSLGLTGDTRDAWNALNLPPGVDRMCLQDINPAIELDLEDLRYRIFERFGSIARAFEDMGFGSSMEVTYKDFYRLCHEIQFRGNHKRLAKALDKTGRGQIALEDIDENAARYIDPEADREIDDRGQYSKRDVFAEFRKSCVQRFGCLPRAWRAIDRNGVGMMTRAEFLASVSITGYKGNCQALWEAVTPEKATHITIRELDNAWFSAMARFYKACVEKHFSLAAAFSEEGEDTPKKKVSKGAFYDLCRDLNIEKSADKMFNGLVTSDGFVSYEEVRFLDEQWLWGGEDPQPRRRNPHESQRLLLLPSGSPSRVVGEGPMMTSMRPAHVTWAKRASSLPQLQSPIRPQWNDRHQVKDTLFNKPMQVIHLINHVNTQHTERIQRRVQKRLISEPLGEWLSEMMEVVEMK